MFLVDDCMHAWVARVPFSDVILLAWLFRYFLLKNTHSSLVGLLEMLYDGVIILEGGHRLDGSK